MLWRLNPETTSHRIAARAHKGKVMKNGRLSGKVAIVTGASKGIGAGIALAMGRKVQPSSLTTVRASPQPGQIWRI
jgi:hypothetical protein